jgi:hypothetical protein
VGIRYVTMGLKVACHCFSRGASTSQLHVCKSSASELIRCVSTGTADIFDSSSYKGELQGAAGVVSCVGAFGSNEFMEKINGDANIRAVETAAQEGKASETGLPFWDVYLSGLTLVSLV